MFAACSKDSDNNDNGGNGGNGGNGNKPVIPTNTIALDNQQKSISSAQYEKTGENSYTLTLFLSDDKKERVELELNENLHMKGNTIDLKQTTTDDFWIITYYASYNGEAYILFEANGSSEFDVPFLEGTLTVKGKPNEQININLKNGRLKDKNGKERTFSINYSGKMEEYKARYGVLIGGVELTSSNYQNINSTTFPAITGGKVTYDPISGILTLDGATIKATGKDVHAIEQPESTTATLTIVLKNSNTLNSQKRSSISVDGASLCITGKGSLTINPSQGIRSIYTKRDLTIEGGCSIVANSQMGVYGTLTINKANVHVTQKDASAIVAINPINLIDCKVVFPEGAKEGLYENYYTFVKDGNFCKEVKIEISK